MPGGHFLRRQEEPAGCSWCERERCVARVCGSGLHTLAPRCVPGRVWGYAPAGALVNIWGKLRRASPPVPSLYPPTGCYTRLRASPSSNHAPAGGGYDHTSRKDVMAPPPVTLPLVCSCAWRHTDTSRAVSLPRHLVSGSCPRAARVNPLGSLPALPLVSRSGSASEART